MKRLLIISLFLLFAFEVVIALKVFTKTVEVIPLTELAGADARWRDGRTTQGTHTVDEIVGMVDGDWTIVIEEAGASSDVYIYIYDADADCVSVDGLLEIEPEAVGTDCWHLAIFHIASLVGEGADKFINVAQSAAPAAPVDGDCYYDTDDQDWCCYNGAGWDCVTLD